jgi:hypothetical protein
VEPYAHTHTHGGTPHHLWHTQICASRYNTVPCSVTAAGQHASKALYLLSEWALHSCHALVRQGRSPPTHSRESGPLETDGSIVKTKGTTGMSRVVSLHAIQSFWTKRGPAKHRQASEGKEWGVTNSRVGWKQHSTGLRPASCSLPALLDTVQTAGRLGQHPQEHTNCMRPITLQKHHTEHPPSACTC